MNNLIEDLERQAIERGWSKGREQGRKEVREQVVKVLVGSRLSVLPADLGDQLAALTDEAWQALVPQLSTITSVQDLESFFTGSRPTRL